MDDPIDEVALNALIASGVDPAVAYEASRIESPTEPPKNEPPRSGCLGLFVFIALVLVWRSLF